MDAGNDRIGINDSSPSHLLTVKADHATNPAIKIEQTGNTDGWGLIANNNEGNLEFSRIGGGTEGTHLTISNVGKVLIGDVASHTTDLLQIETPASGGGHGIQIRRNDSNSDQQVGHILFGNNTATDLASLIAKTDGATDSGAMLFSTSATGGSLTERMRITSGGSLLVGKTSSQHSSFEFETSQGNSKGAQIARVVCGRSATGYPIVGYNCAPTSTVNTYNKYIGDYASWIHFVAGGIDTFTTASTASGDTTGTAGPYVSRGGTSWTSSSDRRLKDKIAGITYGLEAVKSLNPVSYVRNDRDTGATELGFIAQEVDEVVSEVVNVSDDGYYGIQYERLIPVLTKAIQEQQTLIETLQAEVAALKGA
jgi:hypothetical protein